MKERLAHFLRSEGLTAVKFAEIMEVQPSSISHLLSGRNKPNFEFVSRLLKRFPNLNPDWIINGIGNVYKSNQDVLQEVSENVPKEQITNVITSKAKGLYEEAKAINQDEISGVPVDNDISERKKDVFTDVNSVIPDSVESESEEGPNVVSKPISRVIVFYADGSFDEYHN